MTERELGEAADRALYTPPVAAPAPPVWTRPAALVDSKMLLEGLLLGVAYVCGQVLARALAA